MRTLIKDEKSVKKKPFTLAFMGRFIFRVSISRLSEDARSGLYNFYLIFTQGLIFRAIISILRQDAICVKSHIYLANTQGFIFRVCMIDYEYIK